VEECTWRISSGPAGSVSQKNSRLLIQIAAIYVPLMVVAKITYVEGTFAVHLTGSRPGANSSTKPNIQSP
jgi:hypothetical protein